MDQNTIKLLKNRRNQKIKDKLDIWKLLNDSYAGGMQYLQGGHLEQYPRESSIEYKARQKRSVYINHIQPLSDMLSGFIYANTPSREVPTELNYIITQCSKQKSLDSFMQSLSIHSLMYTVFTLVDSPTFDPDEIQTAADREGLNPYCVTYLPWQIRDYCTDDKMKLEWILLDNSYTDNSNPFQKAVSIKQYRLWTKDEYTDFIFDNDNVSVVGPVRHGLGEVPGFFTSWRDIDEDYFTESPMEDVALLDKAIYNSLSCLDEMLTAGSFRSLFFPIETSKDLPDEILKSGIGALTVIPFPSKNGQAPFYAGAELSGIEPFLSALDFYEKAILSKFGLDADREKTFVQSGKAKELEFAKCESLLRLAAEQLENAEKQIFRLAGLWEGITDVKVSITYNRSYSSTDVDTQLGRLYEVASFGFKSLKETAINEIIKKIFSTMEPKQLNNLLNQVQIEMNEVPETIIKIDMNTNGDTSPDITAQQ